MNQDYFNLIPRKNGYFYYYVYDKFGRRVYRSTGEKRKGKAMEIALQRARTGELLEPTISKHIKFKDYAQDFWNLETGPVITAKKDRTQHFSIKSAKLYASSLERVLLPDFGKYYLEELTTGQIQKWLVTATKKYNVSNKTANDYLVNLRHILRQAVLEGYIEKSPADAVTQLANNSKPKGTFLKAQIKLLFANPWEYYPAYVGCLLATKTGMRIGEVCALWVEQLHDDYIIVNANYAEGEGRKCTKAGHERYVPVEPEMIQMLRTIAPMDHGYIFTTNGITPVSNNYFNEHLKEKLDELKIPRTDETGLSLTFHSFRYFFNSRLVIADMDESKIEAIIGHEGSDMTQHYTRLKQDDMEQVRLIQREIC